MKKRIINTVVDILLIAVIFAVTDAIMSNVFRSDKMLLELMVYVVLYGIVFGSKWAISKLWILRKKEEDT